MTSLKGKVAIITGTPSGIGKAGARLFVAAGAKEVKTDIQDGESIAYSTSKWPLRGLSACAASELARAGIRVNTVVPAMCRTPMHASTNTPEVLAHYEPMIPLGRVSEPEEVAQAFVFLASNDAS